MKQSVRLLKKLKLHNLENAKLDQQPLDFNSSSTRFSKAYSFLITAAPQSREALHQMEQTYAQAVDQFRKKKNQYIEDLRKKQAEEMMNLSKRSTDPSKISILVSRQMEEMEEIERKWRYDLERLKTNQKTEYHDFLLKFYDIEFQKYQQERQQQTFQFEEEENLEEQIHNLPGSVPHLQQALTSSTQMNVNDEQVDNSNLNNTSLIGSTGGIFSIFRKKKQEKNLEPVDLSK